jgi:hypothetical protein
VAGVGDEVEFTGVVESMGAGAGIGGQAVAVNAGTEIRDNPQVGQTVEVRALRQADGSLLATRIRAEDSGGALGRARPVVAARPPTHAAGHRWRRGR